MKLSEIPSINGAIWIESVVIHPDIRGLGLGKYLMLKTEQFCKSRGFKLAYLCTIDKQIFYSRIGYKFCKPVTASSGTVCLRPNMFNGNADDYCTEDLLPVREDELGQICRQVFQERPSLADIPVPSIKLPLKELNKKSPVCAADKSQISRVTIHKDFMKKWL